MARTASLLSNARSMRAIAAVLAIVALMVLFAFHQREMQAAKDRAMFAVSATSWKVSELIIETQRFGKTVYLHANGEVPRSAMQLRFDVLWSRIDVVENTDVPQDPTLAKHIADYRTFTQQLDPIIYGDADISREFALQTVDRTDQLGNDMRIAWVAAFAGRQFADVELEIVERGEGMKRQFLIAVLVGMVGFYLFAEIFVSAAAQRKEAQLQAKAQAAAMANAAKSRFLANVSHEIRTPLNGILGMASELSESPLNSDQRSCLRVISQAGDVLLHTLNDVLDLSKVEAGQLEIETAEFDLRMLVSSATSLYRPIAEGKGLVLTANVAEELPELVRGDGRRISQVVHNLIGNAVKFTENGSVTFDVGPGDAAGCVRFVVSDTGVGIDPAVHDKIFEPFSQADSSVTRKKGGTGLGLSISKHLCAEMGGTLRLESTPGVGSVFSFELPLPAAIPSRVEAAQPTFTMARPGGRSPSSVLVVDDNATNRLVIKRFLKNERLRITEAATGAEAIEAVRKQSFEVILMDIQMPVMGGIEAAREVRATERSLGRPAARIIAVTANVMTHQVDEYLAAGMNDVLAKPISKPVLLTKLAPPETGKRHAV